MIARHLRCHRAFGPLRRAAPSACFSSSSEAGDASARPEAPALPEAPGRLDEARPRVLLSRAAAPARLPTSFFVAAGGGAALWVAGGLLLAEAHQDWLLGLAASADFVGGALCASGLAAGAAAAAMAQKHAAAKSGARPKRKKPDDATSSWLPGAAPATREARFDFVLLNDDEWLATATDKLDKLAETHADGAFAAFPADVRASLVAAADSAAEARRGREKSFVDGRAQYVRDALALPAPDVDDLRASLRPRTFVADFDTTKPGRGTSGAVDALEAVVSLLEAVATKHDELVLRVKSPGGAVADFGLAASLLLRLRTRTQVRITATVDTVAASGGYLVAVCADHVVAAPFAFVGSVGVVAGIPNVSRVLEKNEVEYLLFTAGKFKRTITPFNAPTEEARAKMQGDLDEVHAAFKNHVSANRATLDIEAVATGETWLAAQAPRGVVDELATAGEYLRARARCRDVILVLPKAQKQNSILRDALGVAAETLGKAVGLEHLGGADGRIRAEASENPMRYS
ncbi:peptidase family S49-domain-containing protein [Pelagophyceae sp. CCMP2097]|nr:peptidase family S49-domain-containing protein [Pelagophyceae sp. CCMP2097]